MELKRIEEVDVERYDSEDDLLDDLTEKDTFSGSNDDLVLDDDFDPSNLADDFSGLGQTSSEKHNDLLKGIMDFDGPIKQMINGWLGLVWDEDKDKFVKDPHKDPLMNTQCAAYCSGVIRTYARSNNIITTINAEVYDEIMIDAGRDIFINIRSRSEEYGIKNQGDAGSICIQMINTIKLMLSGVVGSKMSEVLKTTVSRQESVVLNDNNRSQVEQPRIPKPKGGLGFLNKLINGG